MLLMHQLRITQLSIYQNPNLVWPNIVTFRVDSFCYIYRLQEVSWSPEVGQPIHSDKDLGKKGVKGDKKGERGKRTRRGYRMSL
jgi:hypothetical protein